MNKYRNIAAVMVVIAGFLGYMLFDFATEVSGFVVVDLDGKGADAIVVLTGGQGRAEQGLVLLRSGLAETLVLAGVHRDADHDSIFLGGLTEAEKEKVILEKRSASTLENATEVAKLAEARGFESIVLITSVYHMKRAAETFKMVLPPDVRIYTYSVSTPNFDPARWWEAGSITILVKEFFKYYYYKILFAVGLAA